MRRHGPLLLCTLALAALAAGLAATAARAHSTPQIRAEQQHAREVLAQVGVIGNKLQAAEDAQWNAEQQLAAVDTKLRLNEHRLHVAKGNLHAAQKRLASRLYSLYVTPPPSTIEVVAGSHSLSQVISRGEAVQALSRQDASLGQAAVRFEHTVQAKEHQLKVLKGKRVAAVAARKAEKERRASELAQEQHLLASIHTTIQQLQAQERQHELELKREAEARLAALARARKAAAAATAAQAAQAQQTSTGSSSAPTTVVPPPGPPVTVSTGNGGAGHAAAASIALRYLGVPYVWGGASPSGFDCSGLVMYVYAQLGISLPHYTVAQWNATEPISSPAPGDLVFFNSLGHVGIYIGGGRFVDAPHTGSVVRIDSISSFGGYDGARRVP
jgi:cell wall-associated NlpC family hydrolase